jgi:predicted  nucleic acid-binding Zn-ribbon protein
MPSQTNATIAALRTLHRTHRQLNDLKERLERGPRVALAHQANVQGVEAELAAPEKDALTLRVATEDKQAQLGTGEAMVEKRRMQLRKAGDNREFQALQDEIAAAEMTNSVLTDEILEAMERLDEVNDRVAQARQAVADTRAESERACREIDEQRPKIQGDIERLETELKHSETDLPGDFRELYRRVVRQKGEDALAQVDNEYCDGCNQHVPVNLINELTLNRPVTCRSCGRLLYLPDGYEPR